MSVRFYDSFVKRLTRDQVPGPTGEGSTPSTDRYMKDEGKMNPELKNNLPKLTDYKDKSDSGPGSEA